jgi:hypothetical protein
MSESVQTQIAKWYLRTDEHPDNHVRRAYQVIARINEYWYDMIPVEVVWTEKDPYDNYVDMKRSVKRDGELRVFSGGSEPNYMSYEQNVKGRAVHDWFGHLQADCDFSLKGEFLKYNHVKHRYPKSVRPLLFSEIVGQRALVGYLDNGFESDKFQQKGIFAPDRYVRLCESDFL